FAWSERAQHLRRLVFQIDVDDGFRRRDHGTVFDEVAQMRIFLFADRRLQRNRFLRDLQYLADLSYRNVHALGNFFRRRLAPKFLHQLPRRTDQLVDGFDHVHRNTDGAGLIGDGAGNGLADPPRSVRGEFIAAAVLKFVHSFHQADVAFLDQVQKLQPAVGIFLRNGNHQAQVRFDELAFRRLGVHVTLDDFALRALEFLVGDAGFPLQSFQIAAMPALDTPEFLLGVVTARGLNLFFQIVDVAVQQPHGVHCLVHAVNQALALRIGELQIADPYGDHHVRPAQRPAAATELARFLLLHDARQLFFQLQDFFVMFADIVNLADKMLQPR